MCNVNDLGLGTCPLCSKWKPLTTWHPKDLKKPKKERRRVCAACDQKHKRATVPFFNVSKLVSSHKSSCKEGDYTDKDMMKLHAAQGGLCAYCRTSIPYAFSIEHIIPRKFGGRNLLYNILLVCESCNSQKQHFELSYWLDKKNYNLNEHIYMKVRESYDRHEYEFKIPCSRCLGSRRKTKPFCAQCNSTS